MEWVSAEAPVAGKSVAVAKNNRAQTLYRWLGLREIADHGVHWDIEWDQQQISAQASIEYYLLRHTPADTPHMTREMIGQCSTTRPKCLCVLINLISISENYHFHV
jgi:hypothetical protein